MSVYIKTPFASTQREALIVQIMPWWTANGWDPMTLKLKPYRELWGIAKDAARRGWPVKGEPTSEPMEPEEIAPKTVEPTNVVETTGRPTRRRTKTLPDGATQLTLDEALRAQGSEFPPSGLKLVGERKREGEREEKVRVKRVVMIFEFDEGEEIELEKNGALNGHLSLNGKAS